MRAFDTISLGALLGLAALGCSDGAAERSAGAVGEPAPLPALTDPVVYDNGWCTFQDAVPYVRAVRFDDELVAAAMRTLGPGFRSTISYTEWKGAYGLESASAADHLERKAAVGRNFIRVLCGENRDDPAAFERKLRLLANGDPQYRAAHDLPALPSSDEPVQAYAGPGEMTDVDVDANLFAQITMPAYERMRVVMKAAHSYRQALRRGPKDGYHYGFRDNQHLSNRVDHSVPPWTHCEMKYLFERWMTPSSPVSDQPWGELHCDDQCAADYLDGYETYRQQCAPEDFETMYDFRGHKVLQPQWLDSNAFAWNSRRAGTLDNRELQQDGDPAYYLHPFASRYARSRALLGSFLLYHESHHRRLMTASEQGGGPILYVTDQDANGDHLADYLLFAQNGCGDAGPTEDDPQHNCNMVSWALAASTTPTTRHAGPWHPEWFDRPDMGFFQTFGPFELRMARLNQAFDRHTNWGPTSYYATGVPIRLVEGGQVVGERPAYYGSYTPFVATSYDIAASDKFARGDYNSTHALERGHLKWMFVIRFRTADYYDENDLANGEPIDFDRHYFNETSLSNDRWLERGLDRFGWIPTADVYANVYFVYGSRGEQPEPIVDLPPPAAPAEEP